MTSLLVYEDSLHKCGQLRSELARDDVTFLVDDEECPGCKAIQRTQRVIEAQLREEYGETAEFDLAMSSRDFYISGTRREQRGD